MIEVTVKMGVAMTGSDTGMMRAEHQRSVLEAARLRAWMDGVCTASVMGISGVFVFAGVCTVTAEVMSHRNWEWVMVVSARSSDKSIRSGTLRCPMACSTRHELVPSMTSRVPARGTWDERSYLQETIKGLTNEESTLLWRARLVGQARAATEARLAAFERRQTAVAPALHIQTPDRRLTPIFAPISKHRLTRSRLAPSGPGANESVNVLSRRNGSFSTTGVPPTGPRNDGSSLVWGGDEGRGGVSGGIRDGYYAR
ncbi:hypothetical protein LTR27_012895 [Elasticomyces elasticus]|nr:hypothetical protein LTR27_012895 [Elasticomyces elasticus]